MCVREYVCKRKKMGVDVWAGDREVAGKVSIMSPLPSYPSRQTRHSPKEPTGPDACLYQQEVALQGLSQSPSTPKPTRERMSHYPHSYPTGLSVESRPKAKARKK